MSDSEHLFSEVDAENLSSPSPPASPSMDTANDAAPASSESPTIIHYTESSTSTRRYSTLGLDSTSPGIEGLSDADIEDDGDDDFAPPTPNPPKRGRPKKAATDIADTTTPPKKRGRKPKLGEDGQPIAKKPRGRPRKDGTEKAAASASSTAAESTSDPVESIPSTPRKGPSTDAGGKGLSTAMTKNECEYILNSFIEGANWGQLIKTTNDQFGQQRQAGNVKTHWKGSVMKALKAMYKDE